MKFFLENNINISPYVLFGLPRVRSKHIEKLNEFMKKQPFKSWSASLFRLSPYTLMYNKLEEFQVKITGSHTINDFIPQSETKVFPVKTLYLDFDSWDEDDNKWKNRRQILEKYRDNIIYNTFPFWSI
jgi:hypothetical protein